MNEKELDEKVFYVISSKYDSFSKVERKIADALLGDKMMFLSCSINTLSRKLGVSPASITRFCQKMNCRGFSELKYRIATGTMMLPYGNELLTMDDEISTSIVKLAKIQTSAVRDTLMRINPDVISIIARNIVRAKTISIYAEGGPSTTAMYAYILFFQLGINCQMFSDAQLSLSSAHQLKAGDVVMYICRTGYSTTILRAVKTAREHHAKVIGITSELNSALSAATDYLIHYCPLPENDMRYLHVARMCELAVIGVLYNHLLKLMPDVSSKINNSNKAIMANQER